MGTTAGTVSWGLVAQRLAPARNYWVNTVGKDGGPHAAPVWGAVVGEVLYFYSEDDTVKARNLARDPRVVVHLESGDDVVIVRGTAELLGRPSGRPDLVAAFAAKYVEPDDAQYLPADADVLNVFYLVRPTSALLWRLDAYEESQCRWAAGAAASAAAGAADDLADEPAIVSDASS
jgi:PPOX class probable F420-dependent enzyme